MIRINFKIALQAMLYISFLSIVWSCKQEKPSTSTDQKVVTIGITQIATHTSLDQVREGIVEGLKQEGYDEENKKNIKILFRNANGDGSLTLPIAQEFVRQKVDVIVPISTPSALGAAKSTDRIPIVFGGVTDPVDEGLVQSLEKPGKNISGTSDQWPFRQQLDLFKKALPGLKKIGYLHKPGDDVSKIAIEQLEAYCPTIGLELVTQPVSGAGEVYSTANALLKKVDAIYVGLDNFIAENVTSVLKAGIETGKPVLAGDEGSLEKGALLSYSISMKDLGVKTAEIIARVLKGEEISNIPVTVVTEGRGIVNKKTAERLGIDIESLQTKLDMEVFNNDGSN